jgi:hypothetical protein
MTFVIMTAIKLGAVLGTGIALSAAFSQFHSYEWKPKSKNKKEKGESDGSSKATKVGEALRQKSGSAN